MDKFSSVLERLFSFHTAGKSSLPQVRQIATALGLNNNTFPVIHVAGSNGKGSVCHKIAKALEMAGYNVGLYASPHLHCYTERIQVNSEKISQEQVIDGLDTLFAYAELNSLKPTFFELTTLLSLIHFRNKQIDVAVVETGLGGRLDATRVYEPSLSIITSISLEHTQLLGNTLDEIAREKAGICKRGVPLILGPKAQLKCISEIVRDLSCPIKNVTFTGMSFDEENQAIAKEALVLLQNTFSRLQVSIIEEALLERPPCRLEKIGSVFFDVAHNPDAFRRLFTEVAKICPNEKIHAVIGLSSDKDVAECLKIAASYAEHITLVQALGSRAAKKEAMAELLNDIGYLSYSLEKSISAALDSAAEIDGVAIVCGSFYIMDEAKSALLINR